MTSCPVVMRCWHVRLAYLLVRLALIQPLEALVLGDQLVELAVQHTVLVVEGHVALDRARKQLGVQGSSGLSTIFVKVF